MIVSRTQKSPQSIIAKSEGYGQPSTRRGCALTSELPDALGPCPLRLAPAERRKTPETINTTARPPTSDP